MTDLKKIREEFDKEFGACRALILPNGTREYTPRHNKIADFFLQKLADHDREIVKKISAMKKTHREFECNGANNGKGCYEDWCEDQNCRNAPKEWNSALDNIITTLTQGKENITS